MVVLTGFVALVVDAGLGYTAARYDHDVADAAALAASYSIWAELNATPAATSLTAATAAARAVAAENNCSGSGTCSAADPIYLASDNSTVTASAQSVSFVKVVVTDSSNNHFGPAAGASSRITTTVEASVTSAGGGGAGGTTLPCQVCVLGGVSFGSSNTDITASNGNIVIDSDVQSSGSTSFITADVPPHSIDIEGKFSAGHPYLCSDPTAYPPTRGNCKAAPNTRAGAFVDPGLAAPVTTGLQPKGAVSTNGSIGPGIYQSISNVSNGTLTLTAGVYVITGPGGMTIAGGKGNSGGTIDATAGVTLYFACPGFPTPCRSSGQQGAGFTLSSKNATLNLTAPASGPQGNIAVYFDPHNTATFEVPTTGFTGTISGAMYMPAGTISLSATAADITASPIVVYHINLTGSNDSIYPSGGNVTVGGIPSSPGSLYCLAAPCRT